MAVITSKPEVVSNPRFRSKVRDLLVELPNTSAGLGLKVAGNEHVVMVYARAGKAISSIGDLLRLTWFSVNEEWEFAPLKEADVRDFLESFTPTS